jgi:hypothetical protein
VKTKHSDAEDEFAFNDITQGVIWDKSDWDSVQKYFALIRETNRRRIPHMRNKMIRLLDEEIERYQNDQTVKLFQPIEVIEKIDKITNSGRTRAAELITKYSTKGFNFMAIGTSQAPPLDGDYKLGNEVGRESSLRTGYISPSGAVIKHVCSFSPNFPSNDYWEIAPVDTEEYSDEQMIFARVVFKPNRPLVHEEGQDFMTVHHTTTTTSGA